MDEIFDVIDGDEGSQDRRITCFVDQIVTVSGKEYRLGYPVDTPVVISLFDDDDDLVPANDSDLEVLMPLAKEALAVKNVELIDSPGAQLDAHTCTTTSESTCTVAVGVVDSPDVRTPRHAPKDWGRHIRMPRLIATFDEPVLQLNRVQ